MTDWQSTRSMTPEALDEALTTLHLSRAALARYLDLTERQVYRWAHGESLVPTPVALLLSSMIAHGNKPEVPKPAKTILRLIPYPLAIDHEP